MHAGRCALGGLAAWEPTARPPQTPLVQSLHSTGAPPYRYEHGHRTVICEHAGHVMIVFKTLRSKSDLDEPRPQRCLLPATKRRTHT